MKWFQLDADTPEDPKIRAVVRALGMGGFGGLVGLWCHVAKHGRVPGYGIDSRGAPLPVEDLIEASGLTRDQFEQLVELCVKTGHFRQDVWRRDGGIWIPAMERRADYYTQRLSRSKQRPIDFAGGTTS